MEYIFPVTSNLITQVEAIYSLAKKDEIDVELVGHICNWLENYGIIYRVPEGTNNYKANTEKFQEVGTEKLVQEYLSQHNYE